MPRSLRRSARPLLLLALALACFAGASALPAPSPASAQPADSAATTPGVIPRTLGEDDPLLTQARTWNETALHWYLERTLLEKIGILAGTVFAGLALWLWHLNRNQQ